MENVDTIKVGPGFKVTFVDEEGFVADTGFSADDGFAELEELEGLLSAAFGAWH